MARVKVRDGICGHTTVIMTTRLDKDTVGIKIVTPCEMIQKLGEELKEVKWKTVFSRDMRDSIVYQAAGKHIKHAGCPVPSAIVRAIEVELDMAPSKGTVFEIEK